jgi:hypothetical protein
MTNAVSEVTGVELAQVQSSPNAEFVYFPASSPGKIVSEQKIDEPTPDRNSSPSECCFVFPYFDQNLRRFWHFEHNSTSVRECSKRCPPLRFELGDQWS